MSRILKPGKVPEPVIPWQETTPFTCPKCGCEWCADAGEWRTIVSMHSANGFPDAGCAGMDCPTCEKFCEIREPGKLIARSLNFAY